MTSTGNAIINRYIMAFVAYKLGMDWRAIIEGDDSLSTWSDPKKIHMIPLIIKKLGIDAKVKFYEDWN